MVIQLKKFGVTLISRQAGREAVSAFAPTLESIPPHEEVIIDFEGVLTFSPSWGDEFLSPLISRLEGRISFKDTDNPSAKATLEILERVKQKKFKIVP